MRYMWTKSIGVLRVVNTGSNTLVFKCGRPQYFGKNREQCIRSAKEARRETKYKPIFTSLDGRKQLSAAKQAIIDKSYVATIKSILR